MLEVVAGLSSVVELVVVAVVVLDEASDVVNIVVIVVPDPDGTEQPLS